MASRTITSEDDLREVLGGNATDVVVSKVADHLNELTRQFVERSPFVCIATGRPDGGLDVSPRGDPAGFVRVLDERTLLLPDRPGNRLADTLTNLLVDPRVALLFLIPGIGDSFRVNGCGRIVEDEALLAASTVDGRPPRLGILVEIEEAYTQCSKALIRSDLWNPEHHIERSELPSGGEILRSLNDPGFRRVALRPRARRALRPPRRSLLMVARAGDADRERAVASLREHFVQGRLTLEELSARCELALHAATQRDLRRSLRELPPLMPHPILRGAVRGVGLVVLTGAWLVFSLVLLLAFALTLAIQGMSALELVVFFAGLAGADVSALPPVAAGAVAPRQGRVARSSALRRRDLVAKLLQRRLDLGEAIVPDRERSKTPGSSPGSPPRSWANRSSFWPGRRGSRTTSSRSPSRASTPSTSSRPAKRWSRSLRPFSSPGVCGPRSISTARIEISAPSSDSASSRRCRNFAVRLPGPLASRAQPRRERPSSAWRIVGSSYSTTGSRFVA